MENSNTQKGIRTVKNSVCQTGGKKLRTRFVNEDMMAYGEGYSFVMDGATGLGGPESIKGLTPAEWYVQMVAHFLTQQLQDKNKDTKQIVSSAINYATNKIREYERQHDLIIV